VYAHRTCGYRNILYWDAEFPEQRDGDIFEKQLETTVAVKNPLEFSTINSL